MRLSLDIGHPEVWNCFSIDAMIKDKSSGYGWGHGMMYIDESQVIWKKLQLKMNSFSVNVQKVRNERIVINYPFRIPQIACKPYHSQKTMMMAG